MRRIRFYVNGDKPEAAAHHAALARRLEEFGLTEAFDDAADAIVALGGDGTILRAVREFRDRPVLGLNFGGLGYLSAVGGEEAERAFRMLSEGRYAISERTLVEARDVKTGVTHGVALNDIALVRGLSGHAARMDLAVDGKPVTQYMADGLVFATPTGSTAYSLAAGGPVVLPDSPTLIVTPMSPHALGVRPLIVRDDVRFTVTVSPRTDGNEVGVGVFADGENVMTLGIGESVEIAKSTRTAKLVALEGYDPYDVLSRKLGWNGSCVRQGGTGGERA